MTNAATDLSQTLGFSGSYPAHEVRFLLNILQMQPTNIEEKEQLIQSGKKHYSSMLSAEHPPSATHLQHYDLAMQLGAARMAKEVQQLGNRLLELYAPEPIVLVSLVRAGVPLGVLLRDYLAAQVPCYHYGVSIIRDRGIDHAALDQIIRLHGAKNIVFVDGWTGKGAITRELGRSLQDYPELWDAQSGLPRLLVLSDLAGCAWLAASQDDWLIPSGVLGSVISGLISRSVLPEHAQQGTWHGCIQYHTLAEHDLSNSFIQQIRSHIQQQPEQHSCLWGNTQRQQQQQQSQHTIDWLMQHYRVEQVNHIKPSIAEATRAVLRRVPERILLKDADHPSTQLLRHFAEQQQVAIDVLGEQLGPYQAVTLIKTMPKDCS